MDESPALAGYRRRSLMDTSSLSVLEGRLRGLEARIERLEASVAREPKPKTITQRVAEVDVSDLDGKEGAFTIGQFCERFNMSRSSFYNLLHSGSGPELVRVADGRPRISYAAAKRWRERYEQAESEGDDVAMP
jgi:hypothetical protein